ncbi:unnamed protein product [Rotaria sp. Silwood1]|nr:unnamed protein product [Rotaria sp. Silwood1]
MKSPGNGGPGNGGPGNGGPGNGGPGRGNDQCDDICGETYQIKVQGGSCDVYQLFTLHKDHTVNLIDNTENNFSPGRGIESQPFTSQLGGWRCVGRNRIQMRTASYNHQVPSSSTPSTLTFNYYVLTFTRNGEYVQGTYKFEYYRLGSYPLDFSSRPLPNRSFGPYDVKGKQFDFFRP